MSDQMYQTMARSDFSRLRTRETLTRILSLLKAQRDEMLSLGDVRSLLRPGLGDLPGHADGAHRQDRRQRGPVQGFQPGVPAPARQDDAPLDAGRHGALPERRRCRPIKLFEIGGVYFVRDGNHRVSVAKAQGAEFIDAEVISLSSEIALSPDMTQEELKRAVIDFEKAALLRDDAPRRAASRLQPGVHRGRALRRAAGAHPRAQVVHQSQEDRGDPLRAGRGVLVRQRVFPHRPDRARGASSWPGSRRPPRRTCTCTSESTGAS